MINYNEDRIDGFLDYYRKMRTYGDCDPSYPALNYICDRFELNKEQRYWIAFLYGCTYCVPTTYYIYNEFPDFENVSVERLQRWWNENKHRLLFQTDRAKIKNFDIFVKIFESYRDFIGSGTQEERFAKITDYNDVKIYYFGRFSLYNYMESLHELCGLDNLPSGLNLKEAESSRNGLCYALGADEWITIHHQKSKEKINYLILHSALRSMKWLLEEENPDLEVNLWNMETVLCAYKKLFWGSRYFGYYIDRMMEEIITMERNVPEGVDWDVLWDFREEFFIPELLGELHDWRGIRKDRMKLVIETSTILKPLEVLPNTTFKRKVQFTKVGDVYGL